jgi:hypothetical protein
MGEELPRAVLLMSRAAHLVHEINRLSREIDPAAEPQRDEYRREYELILTELGNAEPALPAVRT